MSFLVNLFDGSSFELSRNFWVPRPNADCPIWQSWRVLQREVKNPNSILHSSVKPHIAGPRTHLQYKFCKYQERTWEFTFYFRLISNLFRKASGCSWSIDNCTVLTKELGSAGFTEAASNTDRSQKKSPNPSFSSVQAFITYPTDRSMEAARSKARIK